jgi:flagellar M-ring protein FliF
MDKRQVTETKFDPDSKVERSTRTVKESGQNQNGSAANAVTVEQNIPQEVQQSTDGGGAQSKSEKKDETVNYEVNSSQTATVSDDYSIERISVALVLNRQALAGAAEATAASPAPDEKLASISNMVKSAVGFVEKRGDVVDVSAFDFVDNGTALEPLPGPGFGEIISGNLGTLINALAFLIGTLIVILLGLRPSMKLIVGQGQPEQLSSPDPMSALPMQNAQVDFASNFAADTPASPEDPSRSKLNKAVELDLDRAAQVLKQWLDQPGNEAA